MWTVIQESPSAGLRLGDSVVTKLTISWLRPSNKNPAPMLLLVNLRILATLRNT